MPLEAIEPRRLSRQVADQLRQLIDQGEYPVGSRLPTERELVDRLGVSRPTVREALIALEAEGRLRIRVGSGTYVADQQVSPTAGGPLNILRARAFFESGIAAEAALRAKREDVERLDGLLLQLEETRNGQELLGLDRRFHIAVAATLANSVIELIVGELFDLQFNPYAGQLAPHVENTTLWRAVHQEHIAVRDAISARDERWARQAMQKHLGKAQRRFLRNFGHMPSAKSKGPQMKMEHSFP